MYAEGTFVTKYCFSCQLKALSCDT